MVPGPSDKSRHIDIIVTNRHGKRLYQAWTRVSCPLVLIGERIKTAFLAICADPVEFQSSHPVNT